MKQNVVHYNSITDNPILIYFNRKALKAHSIDNSQLIENVTDLIYVIVLLVTRFVLGSLKDVSCPGII